MRARLYFEQIGQLLGDELWDEALIESASGTFEMIVGYILSRGEIDKTAFDHRLKTLQSSTIKSTAMTLAQQFHEEGLQKGLEKGREEGLQEGQQGAVIKVLEARFACLPLEIREKICQIADLSRLQTLLLAAIRCESIDEFYRKLG